MSNEVKPEKNAHLKGVKRIKVQALRDGFFDGSKVIEGAIFIIQEKSGKKRISKYADYTEAIVITVQDQFSKYWMVELEEGDSELHKKHNSEVKERRAKEELLRARDSEVIAANLPPQSIVPKLTPDESPTSAQKAAATKAANKAKKEAEESPVSDEDNVI